MSSAEDNRNRGLDKQKYGLDQETMERYLHRIEIRERKKGKEFDKEKYEKRFKNMDANKDGFLTSEDQSPRKK
jgi:hypothetical protein